MQPATKFLPSFAPSSSKIEEAGTLTIKEALGRSPESEANVFIFSSPVTFFFEFHMLEENLTK